MKSKSSRTDTVVLDLDETIPADIQAKLYKLCKARNLPWPEGIVCLMQEVLEGAEAKKNATNRRQPKPSTSTSSLRHRKAH